MLAERIRELGIEDRAALWEAFEWIVPRGRAGRVVHVHHSRWIAWHGGRRGYRDTQRDVITVLGAGKAGGYVVGKRSQGWCFPPLSSYRRLDGRLVVRTRCVRGSEYDLVVVNFGRGPEAKWRSVQRCLGPPTDFTPRIIYERPTWRSLAA